MKMFPVIMTEGLPHHFIPMFMSFWRYIGFPGATKQLHFKRIRNIFFLFFKQSMTRLSSVVLMTDKRQNAQAETR